MWIRELGSWIGGALVGVVLAAGYEAISNAWRGRRGPLKGHWWQVIPQFGDQPFKLDEVSCRHNRLAISAWVRRTTPASQADRSWRFEGRIQGSLLYGVFFSKDGSDLSYGTIQLHKDNELGTVWRGTYSRVHLSSGNEGWTERMSHIPLTWQREAPEDLLDHPAV